MNRVDYHRYLGAFRRPFRQHPLSRWPPTGKN